MSISYAVFCLKKKINVYPCAFLLLACFRHCHPPVPQPPEPRRAAHRPAPMARSALPLSFFQLHADPPNLPSFPTHALPISTSSPLSVWLGKDISGQSVWTDLARMPHILIAGTTGRSEEHTSELQSHVNLVCRLLLEKKNQRLPVRILVAGLLPSLPSSRPAAAGAAPRRAPTGPHGSVCAAAVFFSITRRPPKSTLFPYTRSSDLHVEPAVGLARQGHLRPVRLDRPRAHAAHPDRRHHG